MTAGNRKVVTRGVYSRARNTPGIDRAHQGNVRKTRPGAGVSNGCKPRLKSLPPEQDTIKGPVCRRFSDSRSRPVIAREIVERKMGMHVKKTGQHSAVTKINGFGVCW